MPHPFWIDSGTTQAHCRWRLVLTLRASGRVAGTLASGMNSDFPWSFAESADGVLLIANGIDPVMRWDGVSFGATPAGCPAPTSAPTLSGVGGEAEDTGGLAGNITGQYETIAFDMSKEPYRGVFAGGNGGLGVPLHLRQATYNQYRNRFRDPAAALHFFFDVLPTPIYSGSYSRLYRAKYDKFSLEVTRSSATVADDGTLTGRITGLYSAFVRFVDRNGNVSDPSPISAEVQVTNVVGIGYTEIPVPTSNRVVLKQLWRNTSGQSQNYFLDLETDDLGLTQYVSTKTNTDLQMSDPLALEAADGTPLAFLYGVPPSDKPFVAAMNNHMFLAGSRSYTIGSASTTHGSATVTGQGTTWLTTFIGRFFQPSTDQRAYEILSVDPAAQTLTLAESYQGPTDPFANYAIRPSDAERNLVHFTEAGLPESWPLTSAVALEEDGDDVTGLLPFAGYLYVTKRRHLYRLSFKSSPREDLAIFIACHRGLVNDRCAVAVDGVLYGMDDQGAYAFSGGEAESLSVSVQDLFRRAGLVFRVNWNAADWFHAVHTPDQDTIRWFVCLSGDKRPRHALCLHYRAKMWHVEEYPFPVTASVLADVGHPRPVVGGPAAKCYALDESPLDVIDPSAGDTRELVASATVLSVTLEDGTLPDDGVVGAPVAVVAGKGKGQVRRVVAVSGLALTIDRPWLIWPAGTGEIDQSTVQLGGVPWQWRSGRFPMADEGVDTEQGIEVYFTPATEGAGTMDLRTYMDGAHEPLDMGRTQSVGGITTTADDPDTMLDLDGRDTVDGGSGFGQGGVHRVDRDDGREPELAGEAHQLSVELRGFSGADRVVIEGVRMEGVEARSA